MKELFIKPSKQAANNRLALIINSLVVVLFLVGILLYSFHSLKYEYNWSALIEYKELFKDGFLHTLLLSIVSLFFSLLIGLTLSCGQRNRIYFIKLLSKCFVELVRGTPLLVQVLVFFYVIATAVNLENRFVTGVIILSIFSGCYLAEIFRGGIESIGKSNYETAKAIGLTKFQTYRYVIFPQIIRAVLPSIAGQLVSLIKDSSLLSIIAVKELTMVANEMNAATFSTIEAYLPLTIGYLVITIPISALSKYLEKRFYYES